MQLKGLILLCNTYSPKFSALLLKDLKYDGDFKTDNGFYGLMIVFFEFIGLNKSYLLYIQ